MRHVGPDMLARTATSVRSLRLHNRLRLPRLRIQELALLDVVDHAENVVQLRQRGAGKTHLAIGVGLISAGAGVLTSAATSPSSSETAQRYRRRKGIFRPVAMLKRLIGRHRLSADGRCRRSRGATK